MTLQRSQKAAREIVLAGDWAANGGVIAAKAGHVVLATCGRLTLDLAGDGLVNFAVDEATLAGLAGARNSGTLSARRPVLAARVDVGGFLPI